MTQKIEALASFLNDFTQGWPRSGMWPPQPYSQRQSAEDLAQLLLSDPAFRKLKIGGLFAQPSKAVIESAVKVLTGAMGVRLHQPDGLLLTAALGLAAEQLREETRREIAAGLVIVAGLAAIIGAGRQAA